MGTSPGPWRWAKSASGKGFAGSHLESANGAEIFSVDYGTPVEQPEDMALIRLAPDMAAMLRELEWAGGGESISLCPICGKRPEYTRYVPGEEVPGQPGFVYHTAQRVTVPGGHAPDCRLSALLKELPGGDR